MDNRGCDHNQYIYLNHAIRDTANQNEGMPLYICHYSTEPSH